MFEHPASSIEHENPFYSRVSSDETKITQNISDQKAQRLNKSKQRLDLSLVDKGLAPSRQRARALIMAGKILVNGLPAAKAGTLVSEDDRIELKGGDIPYVSRGGLKLEGALKELNLTIADCTCLDVGASTGGFTDCLLQNGAARVYAVDVGYGQLAWKLRQDPASWP